MKLWLLCQFACIFAISAATGIGAESRPNILVFIADDMGVEDCGAYGHAKIRTPTLDRLAAEGMRFDQAFLTCSSCSPSRASILTGRYPHNTGAHQLHLPLPASQLLVSEVLRDAGYYTAAVGKWHLGNAAKPKFDEVREGKVDQMVPALRDRPRDQPFFGWFAFVDPHRPYQQNTIETPHTVEDVVVPPYLPDTKEVRDDLAMYYDEISRMDRQIGEVLEEVERQEIADDTLVVFLSDNGRPFPRCKTTVYDSGIQTPFIVRWPGHVKPGTATDALVSSVDLAATVCEVAGVEAPSSFQGRSFAAVFGDPAAEHREFVFAEHNWHDYEARERAVRTTRLKYIRNFYNELPGTPPADAVRSPTYEVMKHFQEQGKLDGAQKGPFVVPRPAEELYDLENDSFELTNLAEDATFASELQTLRKVLQEWQVETKDDEPASRRSDGFDRETGEPLAKKR